MQRTIQAADVLLEHVAIRGGGLRSNIDDVEPASWRDVVPEFEGWHRELNVTLGDQTCKESAYESCTALRVMRTCTWINTLLLLCLTFVAAACQDRAGGAS